MYRALRRSCAPWLCPSRPLHSFEAGTAFFPSRVVADSVPSLPLPSFSQPLAEEDYPQTDFPSDREARIANRYNTMTSEMKFTPFWIDAPTKANQGNTSPTIIASSFVSSFCLRYFSLDIERWTDRYKKGPTKFGGGGDSDEKEPQTLESIKVDRRLDKGLLPAAVFEAVYEKKKRVRAGGDDGELEEPAMRRRGRNGMRGGVRGVWRRFANFALILSSLAVSARSARRKQVKLDTVLGEAVSCPTWSLHLLLSSIAYNCSFSQTGRTRRRRRRRQHWIRSRRRSRVPRRGG